MKFVEIYKLQNDGSKQIVTMCKLVGSKVVCEGEKRVVENLESKGILCFSKTPPEELFPKDEIRFLERLPFVFKSGYLNAYKVKEN